MKTQHATTRRTIRLSRFQERLAAQRRPGLVDQISTCESRLAARILLSKLENLDRVSSKTLNKARRLVDTLDFPQP